MATKSCRRLACVHKHCRLVRSVELRQVCTAVLGSHQGIAVELRQVCNAVLDPRQEIAFML